MNPQNSPRPPLSFPSARRLLGWAGLVAGLWGGASPAQVIVFDNLGSANASLDLAYSETGPHVPGQSQWSQGDGFIPSASGNLSTLTLAVGNWSGTDDLHLFLAQANGTTGTPGNLLESWVIPGLPQFGANYHPPVVTSLTHPFLQAGSIYFLYEAEPGDEDNGWRQNSAGQTGFHIASWNGGPYSLHTQIQGAFRVTVAPVPEPSSFSLLFALSLAGGTLLRTRR